MDGTLVASKSRRSGRSRSLSKGGIKKPGRTESKDLATRSVRRTAPRTASPEAELGRVQQAEPPVAPAPVRIQPSSLALPLPVPTSREGCVAVAGAAGDHPLVQQLLQAVFPGSARHGFAASLEDPFYEPRDRLLIKRGEHVVAHAQVTRREMHFGDTVLPVGGLYGVAALPEYRGQGHGRHLLQMAQTAMIDDGNAVGWLRTRIPHFFRPLGWAVCGRHNRARARTRDLLAQLAAIGRTPGPGNYSIRPWRQVELPALERLYAQNTRGSFGPLLRTESYWRWLVSRHDATQVLVAIHGPDKMDLNSSLEPIVGYAVTRDDQILELMVSSQHPQARYDLLARACGDLIERDQHTIELHAPRHDPLLQQFLHAGGSLSQSEVHDGEVYMAWLADPFGFLRSRCEQLHANAIASQCKRPVELGLDMEGQRQRIIVSRRSVRIAGGQLGRHTLRMGRADFTRLVLGHLDVAQAVAQGRVRSSTRTAVQLATALFPQVAWWRPPLDELLLCM